MFKKIRGLSLLALSLAMVSVDASASTNLDVTLTAVRGTARTFETANTALEFNLKSLTSAADTSLLTKTLEVKTVGNSAATLKVKSTNKGHLIATNISVDAATEKQKIAVTPSLTAAGAGYTAETSFDAVAFQNGENVTLGKFDEDAAPTLTLEVKLDGNQALAAEAGSYKDVIVFELTANN
ncbi:MAG: hypothetical protein J0G29_02310 [Alphaproteobacteria bacterium]|nr:hypothetical protein [Alphaproteobacteria bacterium]OJV45687.1 MAG: hypothetical protein BGO28_02400 [Alphaproteobacteria bacterium 43-37]